MHAVAGGCGAQIQGSAKYIACGYPLKTKCTDLHSMAGCLSVEARVRRRRMPCLTGARPASSFNIAAYLDAYVGTFEEASSSGELCRSEEAKTSQVGQIQITLNPSVAPYRFRWWPRPSSLQEPCAVAGCQAQRQRNTVSNGT